jgi:ligand-binding sensor domain-containing protein
VYELYKDESGIIWIGTQNGISRYTPQKNLFNALHLNYTGDDDFPIKLIYTDKEFVWFAYNNQLWLLTDPTAKMKLICSLDKSAEITCLYRTFSGDLCIGTSGDKLFFISRDDIERFV